MWDAIMVNKAFYKSSDDGAGRHIWEGKWIHTQNDYSSEKKKFLFKKKRKHIPSVMEGTS